MSQRIYNQPTLNFASILDLSTLQLPIPNATNAEITRWCFACGKNLVVVYQQTTSAPLSAFKVTIVNSQGHYMDFATPVDTKSLNGHAVSYIFPLSNGLLYIGTPSGDTYLFNANLFVASNNPVPYPLYPTASIPISTPCFSSLPNELFYDAKNALLGAAFFDPLGQQGGPVYSSTYQFKNSDLVLVSQGFVGMYNNNSDPYYSTNNTGATLVANTTRYWSNGLASQMAYENNGNPYGVVIQTFTVTPGSPTACGSGGVYPPPNGASCYGSGVFAPFVDDGYQQYINNWDVVQSGLVGAGNNSGTFGNTIQLLDSDGNVIQFPTSGPPDPLQGGAVVDGGFYGLNRSGPGLYNVNISYSSGGAGINNSGWKKGPLRNYARPVSIFGRWQA